jgi:hypothetical protein
VADYLKKRQIEWGVFQETNRKAQTTIDAEIARTEAALSSDKHVPERLAAVERRTQWCLERIAVWRAEDDKKQQLHVANEELWKKLAQLEAAVVQAEKRIAPHDGKGFPAFPPPVVKKFPKVPKPCPTLADGRAPLGAVTLPNRLKWTYTQKEAADDFPQLPP